MKLFVLIFFIAAGLRAQTNDFSATNFPAHDQTNSSLTAFQHSEQIRADCLQGRRLICGKILKVLPDGLVVESGYTDFGALPSSQIR